jgi:hypothetical protein
MKFYFALVCFFTLSLGAFAQQKPTDIDKSPLDVSYYPQNFPILKMNGKAGDVPVARVIYSRPNRNNREIFGGIVKHGEIWRLGANEATEIEFFRNVKLNGKTINKGRYTLWAQCNEDKWTMILNTEKDIWGLFYNPKKDVVRFDVPVQRTNENVESFTMYFDQAKDGALLNILWDNVKVAVPIKF